MPREDGNFIALLLSLLLDPLKSAKCSFTPEEEDQLASRNQYVTHRSVGSTFDQASEQEEKWQTNRFVILSAVFLMEKGGGNSLSFLLAEDCGNWKQQKKDQPIEPFHEQYFHMQSQEEEQRPAANFDSLYLIFFGTLLLSLCHATLPLNRRRLAATINDSR